MAGGRLPELRRRLHGNGAAKGVPDEMNVLIAGRQGHLDEARLISQGLHPLARPRWGFPISVQIYGTDPKASLQILHQAAPLPRARDARMHQHDQAVRRARLEEMDRNRNAAQLFHWLLPKGRRF